MNEVVLPPDDSLDQGLPWHFGDPLREQRYLLDGSAYVDLSNRGVLSISGPDRLSWLNDLSTALLLELAPDDPRITLLLDPQGHVEHELHLVDDGETTWLITAPGEAEELVQFLTGMQFLLRVEVKDRTADCAVIGSLAGQPPAPAIAIWRAPGEFSGLGDTPAGSDRGGDPSKYVPRRPDLFTAVEAIVARQDLTQILSERPHRAGTWAWEALRIAAAVPRAGADTDARSLPHEVGWIGSAVHLAKGCYRGQEAVARTHNMGRPPRRLVLLHLDGSAERLPEAGARVTLADKDVGWVGSSALHHELGPVALATVKRRIDPDADLQVAGIAARQEPVVQ